MAISPIHLTHLYIVLRTSYSVCSLMHLWFMAYMQVYKVETAGDCYIIAGALMAVDEEGFTSLEDQPDPRQGADRVMAFSKV